ncbi:MAG: hypothetical protein ACOYOU_00960 [Kiritimatiellia bacterium]
MPSDSTNVGVMNLAMAPIRARLSRYSAETILEYTAFQIVNDLLNLPPWNMLDAIQACADHRDMGRSLDDAREAMKKLTDSGAVQRTEDGFALTIKGARDPGAADMWANFLRATRRVERLRKKTEAIVTSTSATA